jgi:predicted nucleic acid-binding protein
VAGFVFRYIERAVASLRRHRHLWLPGDARLAAEDAARLLDARFTAPLVLSAGHAREVHVTLSRIGIAGGAVYDALVALAAREHGAPLATRDARARGTYDAVGVKVIVVS